MATLKYFKIDEKPLPFISGREWPQTTVEYEKVYSPHYGQRDQYTEATCGQRWVTKSTTTVENVIEYHPLYDDLQFVTNFPVSDLQFYKEAIEEYPFDFQYAIHEMAFDAKGRRLDTFLALYSNEPRNISSPSRLYLKMLEKKNSKVSKGTFT